jgi:hypothetical protein
MNTERERYAYWIQRTAEIQTGLKIGIELLRRIESEIGNVVVMDGSTVKLNEWFGLKDAIAEMEKRFRG